VVSRLKAEVQVSLLVGSIRKKQLDAETFFLNFVVAHLSHPVPCTMSGTGLALVPCQVQGSTEGYLDTIG
jgi:hypothetical protein